MNRKNKNGVLELLLFAGPSFLFVVLVTIIPFLMNLYYSFYKWDGISTDMKYVGLGNFVRMFTRDVQFRQGFGFTFQFALVFILVVNVLALVAANFLTESSLLTSVSRSFFFVPYIISLVAISLIWEFLLGPGFSYLYEVTKLEIFGISWLGDPTYAFLSILIVTIWQNLGFYMIIYIAGFMAIPKSLIEASAIDGANPRQRFLRIKVPLLMPAITICSFYSLTYGLKLFDIILVLTKGGPGSSTKTVAYDIYTEAFLADHYGLATAKSLVFFLVVLLVTIVQLRFFKSKEVEY